MTPASLADLYGGFIGTDSAEYRTVTAELRNWPIPLIRQTRQLAPAGSRLRCLADAELGRRAAARLAAAPVPAAFAVPARPRRDSIEEL